MVIKNITKFSPEESYNLLYKSAKRANLRQFIFPTVLFVMGIIIILLSFINENLESYIRIGGIFSAVAVGFFIYNFYLLARIDKAIRKRNPEVIENGIIYEFTFKEESFTVISKSGKLVDKFNSPYKDIQKIIKKDDSIIFVLNRDTQIFAKNEGFNSSRELELFFFGLNKHKIKIK